MRYLVGLVLLISSLSLHAGSQVWVSWYNRYESSYHMPTKSEYDWKWVASKGSSTVNPRYWYTTWSWVNGTLQPGYPVTTYSPFPTSFDNCSVSYWADNGNTLIDDNTTTYVSVRADSHGSTIRFYLKANLVDDDAHYLGVLNTYRDITVAPNGTYYGNPFAGYNFNSGSLVWINLF